MERNLRVRSFSREQCGIQAAALGTTGEDRNMKWETKDSRKVKKVKWEEKVKGEGRKRREEKRREGRREEERRRNRPCEHARHFRICVSPY